MHIVRQRFSHLIQFVVCATQGRLLSWGKPRMQICCTGRTFVTSRILSGMWQTQPLAPWAWVMSKETTTFCHPPPFFSFKHWCNVEYIIPLFRFPGGGSWRGMFGRHHLKMCNHSRLRPFLRGSRASASPLKVAVYGSPWHGWFMRLNTTSELAGYQRGRKKSTQRLFSFSMSFSLSLSFSSPTFFVLSF